MLALGETGSPTAAQERSGYDRVSAYNLKKSDPAFAEGWEAAVDRYVEKLEREADRRGVEGWDEPHFGSLGSGEGTGVVGYVRRHSDLLLIFRLKALAPDKYRERQDVNVSGAVKFVRVSSIDPDDDGKEVGKL